jgi:hypothetical protein
MGALGQLASSAPGRLVRVIESKHAHHTLNYEAIGWMISGSLATAGPELRGEGT